MIRARFTDDTGASSVTMTTLDVHAGNIAPVARIEPPRAVPQAPRTAAAASGWTVHAVDPDGTIVRYEDDLDGDGTLETERGGDAGVPDRALDADVVSVRVTDDSGAGVIERATSLSWLQVPHVEQVGVPAPLSIPDHVTGVVWDADGDGAFDDGTGNRISFTYPATGVYEGRARATAFRAERLHLETISVREADDIAVPAAEWRGVPPARATAPSLLTYDVTAQAGADASLDLAAACSSGGSGDRPRSR